MIIKLNDEYFVHIGTKNRDRYILYKKDNSFDIYSGSFATLNQALSPVIDSMVAEVVGDREITLSEYQMLVEDAKEYIIQGVVDYGN